MLFLILFIVVALVVWIATTFCLAFAFIGYQFKPWYHWSSLVMYFVTFGQPLIYVIVGIELFS